MFKALLRTPNDFAILCIRVTLGASLLPHGLAKLGLFTKDGPGLFEAMGDNAEGLGAMVGGDPWMGYLAIAAEVLGSIALIFGFFGRFCALCIAGLMGVAAWKVGGLEAGTADAFMTWWKDAPGDPTYGGYHLLAIGASLAILIRGSGALSVDHALAPKHAYPPA